MGQLIWWVCKSTFAVLELSQETWWYFYFPSTLGRHRLLAVHWRHNDGVWSHRCLDCLLKRLFGRRSNKRSKQRPTGLCEGNHWWSVDSPHKGPVTKCLNPFDDIIMEPFLMEDRQPLSHPRNSVDYDALSNQHIGLVYSVFTQDLSPINFLLSSRLESWWWQQKTNTRIIIEIQTKYIHNYSIKMIDNTLYIHTTLYVHTHIYAKLCTRSYQSNTFPKYFSYCTFTNTCKFPAIKMEVGYFWETCFNSLCLEEVTVIVNIIIRHSHD